MCCTQHSDSIPYVCGVLQGVLGVFGRFGSAYVFPVCQKIKEKYFSFLGGDLASVGLSNCATKLCVKLYTGPPNYFFFEMISD